MHASEVPGANRSVVLLSGGLDSAVALAACAESDETTPLAVTIVYGQRNVREVEAARQVARHYEAGHVVVDLSSWGAVIRGHSSLLGCSGSLVGAPTVVPNRNAVLISIGGSLALAHGCSRVVIATHAGDHDVYRDCRPEFLNAAHAMLVTATGARVSLYAPFRDLAHSAVATAASRLNVPLAATWSCYDDTEVQCGWCGSCVERRKALAEAGVPDPTPYKRNRPAP